MKKRVTQSNLKDALFCYEHAVKAGSADGMWHYVLLFSRLNELDEPKWLKFVGYLTRIAGMFQSELDKHDCFVEIFKLQNAYPEWSKNFLMNKLHDEVKWEQAMKRAEKERQQKQEKEIGAT